MSLPRVVLISAFLTLVTCISTSKTRDLATVTDSLDYPKFLELLRTSRAATIADALASLKPAHSDYLLFRTTGRRRVAALFEGLSQIFTALDR